MQPLTDHQTEALKVAGRLDYTGLVRERVAEVLSIRPFSAHKLVEAACHHLSAYDLTAGVFLGLSEGILRLPDLGCGKLDDFLARLRDQKSRPNGLAGSALLQCIAESSLELKCATPEVVAARFFYNSRTIKDAAKRIGGLVDLPDLNHAQLGTLAYAYFGAC